jgi:hypothetical protein
VTRYDLLVCRRCQARWFTIDKESPPSPVPCEHPTGRAYDHEWWSQYQFFADSNGPGLHPTQQSGLRQTVSPVTGRTYDLQFVVTAGQETVLATEPPPAPMGPPPTSGPTGPSEWDSTTPG